MKFLNQYQYECYNFWQIFVKKIDFRLVFIPSSSQIWCRNKNVWSNIKSEKHHQPKNICTLIEGKINQNGQLLNIISNLIFSNNSAVGLIHQSKGLDTQGD